MYHRRASPKPVACLTPLPAADVETPGDGCIGAGTSPSATVPDADRLPNPISFVKPLRGSWKRPMQKRKAREPFCRPRAKTWRVIFNTSMTPQGASPTQLIGLLGHAVDRAGTMTVSLHDIRALPQR